MGKAHNKPLHATCETHAREWRRYVSMKVISFGDKVVESFRVSAQWLEQGRNCVYFKSIYETWSVVEAWQAEKLCSCATKKHNKPLQPIAREDARSG